MIDTETYQTTATINSAGFFEHFGIHPITASLYGNKESEIINVAITVSRNQHRPSHNLEVEKKKPDYWAWWNYKQSKFTMIYAKFFLLNMCFPSGIDATEESGEGKAYRVNITQQL